MDEDAKRRLVGAAVLVALMVIFVPMLVNDDKGEDPLGEPIVIPNPPAFDDRFDSSVEPGPNEFRQPVPRPRTQSESARPDTQSANAHSAVDLRPGVVQREPVKPVAPTPPPPAPAPARPTVTQPPPPSAAATPSQSAASGPASVPPGVESWVVQVASLSVPDAAERLRNELRGKGYPAFIEQANINGATYYRVRVGPEVDRARADRIARDIGAVTGGAPLVQHYR